MSSLKIGNSSEAYILCLNCRGTFTEEQTKGWGCPTCGNQGVPGDTRKKATLTLTHHEWRVIFMWADNWSAKCLRDDPKMTTPMPSILREVMRQAPDLPSLTLMSEVQDVANALGTKAEIHGPDGIQTVEPEKKH